MSKWRRLICRIFGHKPWPLRFIRPALVGHGVLHCRRCGVQLFTFA